MSLSERIIELVCGWVRIRNCRLIFQQDNSLAHKALERIQELQKRGIITMDWPASSLDLNVIKEAWIMMKDYTSKRSDEHIKGDALWGGHI